MKVLRSDYEIGESFVIAGHHRKEMYTHEPLLSRRTEIKYRLIGLVGCK
jgi:hypothetical protein